MKEITGETNVDEVNQISEEHQEKGEEYGSKTENLGETESESTLETNDSTDNKNAMELIRTQSKAIVELQRIVSEQKNQIRLLQWRSAGFAARGLKGAVLHSGDVLALALNREIALDQVRIVGFLDRTNDAVVVKRE